MLNPFSSEALRRLDAWLTQICDAEERRAAALSGRSGGWDAVRRLVDLPAEALAFSEVSGTLVPPGPHPLASGGGAFELTEVECEVLIVLLAPHLEPRYQQIYGVLQDDLVRRWATRRLLLTILGRTPDRRRAVLAALSSTGRLSSAGLLFEPVVADGPLGQTFEVAEEVRAALMGLPAPRRLGEAAVRVHDAVGSATGAVTAHPFEVVAGPGDGLAIARRLAGSEAVLLVDGVSDRAPMAQAAAAGWRLATFRGERATIDLRDLSWRDAADVAKVLYARVRADGGRAIVLSLRPLPIPVPHHPACLPSFAERRDMWRALTTERGHPIADDGARRLASTHRMGLANISAVVDAAGPQADEDALNTAAFRLVQVDPEQGLRVEPRRTFEDLIVRESTREALERLVYYVRNRDDIADATGIDARFDTQRGPVVLFAGCPGTGKTLAAEVLARELGRTLYVVDLSQLVDKYIGETEKNLDRVLSQCERSNAVLLFDEADTLFGKRTEVSSSNDRYANLEVGYLLQRIELHHGLVILATNLSQNVDEAFLRRFHARIEFPRPEPPERRKIWSLMVPPGVPRAPDLCFDDTADAHRLTGGEIRNAALKAIFLSRQHDTPLARRHVEEAVRLELFELGRLSRTPLDDESEPDRGALIRQVGEALQDVLERAVRTRFLKEVHFRHGPPTNEALAGYRPAISLALFRLAIGRGGVGTRLGFIASTWSNQPEEEYELLGVLYDVLGRRPVIQLGDRPIEMRVAESFDFDLLHRFWSSHGHPVRASMVLDLDIGEPQSHASSARPRACG